MLSRSEASRERATSHSVAVALGELLQLLEDLASDVGLLAAQVDGLRMVRTEARGDLLLALGDRQIAGPQAGR